MSDIKFSCPNCEQRIACDESHRGVQIDCPTCSTAITVPEEAPSLSLRAPAAPACPGCSAPVQQYAILCTECGYNFRTQTPFQNTSATNTRSRSKERQPAGDFAHRKWIGISCAAGFVFAAFGVLLSDFAPEASRIRFFIGSFLLWSGFVMTVVTGVKILVNAFRRSLFWGIGILTPLLGSLLWLVFVIRNWKENRSLVLWNIAAAVVLMVGAASLPDDVGLEDGQWTIEFDGGGATASGLNVSSWSDHDK